MTGRDLYDVLGSTTLNDSEYTFTIAVDGETEESVLDTAYFTKGNIVRSNTNGVGGTADGVLTEVYVDVVDKEVTIAIMNTYLAIADNDYDEDDDELDILVYAIEDVGSSTYMNSIGETERMTVAGEDFAIADYVDEDIILVTVAKGEVQSVADPEIISDATITTFRTQDRGTAATVSGVDYVIADGTRYNDAATLQYDPEVLEQYTDGTGTINLKDITYNLILDPYGNLIGLEQNEDPDQYLFLTGF